MSTRWVRLLSAGWVALACASRPGGYAAPATAEPAKLTLEPAGAPTQPAASAEMLVELSGRRVSVSGEVAGAEPQALQRALTKHGNGASMVLLRARPEADLTMLKEVLNALPPVNAPKLVIDIGDVHLEMTRPGAGRADHRPPTTVIAQVNTRRRLWRVDNVSGTFEDLAAGQPVMTRASKTHAASSSAPAAVTAASSWIWPTRPSSKRSVSGSALAGG